MFYFRFAPLIKIVLQFSVIDAHSISLRDELPVLCGANEVQLLNITERILFALQVV